MKTTVDLPGELVRRLKLRAIRNGQKLKDTYAEMLTAGLAVDKTGISKAATVVIKDKKTGLLAIQGRNAATTAQEMTPERVAEVLSEQEAVWARESA